MLNLGPQSRIASAEYATQDYLLPRDSTLGEEFRKVERLPIRAPAKDGTTGDEASTLTSSYLTAK